MLPESKAVLPGSDVTVCRSEASFSQMILSPGLTLMMVGE
jgi:hypothetical protein